jgi:hypothetical protein
MGQGVDWEKADIYSLSKTCLYILTGEIVEDAKDFEKIDICEIYDGVKIILMEMINNDPGARPGLSELMDALRV